MTPTLPEFLKVLSETFTSDVEVAPEVRFRDLEDWSSMQALIVIAAIDEHFGVTIPEKKFRAATTFEDLFKLITSAKDV